MARVMGNVMGKRANKIVGAVIKQRRLEICKQIGI